MTTDLSKYDASQLPSADVLGRQRYAIIVADWNSEITYAMAQGALYILNEEIVKSLKENGVAVTTNKLAVKVVGDNKQ